jgi:hypothetical protein
MAVRISQRPVKPVNGEPLTAGAAASPPLVTRPGARRIFPIALFPGHVGRVRLL